MAMVEERLDAERAARGIAEATSITPEQAVDLRVDFLDQPD
jgi:hypothetical protein